MPQSRPLCASFSPRWIASPATPRISAPRNAPKISELLNRSKNQARGLANSASNVLPKAFGLSFRPARRILRYSAASPGKTWRMKISAFKSNLPRSNSLCSRARSVGDRRLRMSGRISLACGKFMPALRFAAEILRYWLGSGPRNRFRVGYWQFCGFPAIGAVGVPVDARIAPLGGALCGVPAHPAIGEAIEHDRGVAAALDGGFEMLAKIA